MGTPRSRESLQAMRRRGRHGPSERPGELESTLDHLLDHAQADATRERDDVPAPEPTPTDRLRTLIPTEFDTVVERLNQRYSERNILVTLDASDFLGGGLGVLIEIAFQGASLKMEGTVLADAIAFHETRRFSDRPGSFAGGPMLRIKNITAELFNDFLHERMIALVKAAAAKT